MQKPLQEFRDNCGELGLRIISEDKVSGRMRVGGLFQLCDVKNGNGRIYPSGLWERVCADPKIQERIRRRGMLGEVEHPQDGQTHLRRVSHFVSLLRKEGSRVYGEAEILATEAGRDMQVLARAGIPLGISSRGKGTSRNEMDAEVVSSDDYVLETFDIVCSPSTPDAYLQLVESQKGPFRKDCPMSEKLDALKRIDVRAGEIQRYLSGSPSVEQLLTLSTELVEAQTNASTLKAQAPDQLGEYAGRVLGKVESLREEIAKKIDTLYAAEDPVFRLRCEEALKNAGGPPAPSDTAKLIRDVQARADYWRQQAQQTAQKLESMKGYVEPEKHESAAQLVDSLTKEAALKERTVADLRSRLGKLQERYEASLRFLEEIVEKNDRARLIRRIREAINQRPQLAAVQQVLLSCPNMKELERQIAVLGEALDKAKDVTVLGSRFYMDQRPKRPPMPVPAPKTERKAPPPAAPSPPTPPSKEGPRVRPTPTTQRVPLPVKGEAANGEQILAESQGVRSPIDTGDTSIDTVARVLKKRAGSGWK